jgi:hypothetical protein
MIAVEGKERDPPIEVGLSNGVPPEWTKEAVVSRADCCPDPDSPY